MSEEKRFNRGQRLMVNFCKKRAELRQQRKARGVRFHKTTNRRQRLMERFYGGT